MNDKYAGKDNYGKPKSDYLARLAAMDDAALFAEAQSMIWHSGYAHNNPRSDYHWRADATFDEAERRGKPEIYDRAYKYTLDSIR